MRMMTCQNCGEEVEDRGVLFEQCPECGVEMLHGSTKRLSDEEDDGE